MAQEPRQFLDRVVNRQPAIFPNLALAVKGIAVRDDGALSGRKVLASNSGRNQP